MFPILKEQRHQNKVMAIIKAARQRGSRSGPSPFWEGYRWMYRMCSIPNPIISLSMDERASRYIDRTERLIS